MKSRWNLRLTFFVGLYFFEPLCFPDYHRQVNFSAFQLSAIKRICNAESAASNAPKEPEYTDLDSYPLTENDAIDTEKVAAAFHAVFGDKAHETGPASASEDFSIFGRSWKVPYVFWFVGGTDPKTYLDAIKNNELNSIPSNHSPKFAPVINPTLKTGLQAMMTAAAAFFN